MLELVAAVALDRHRWHLLCVTRVRTGSDYVEACLQPAQSPDLWRILAVPLIVLCFFIEGACGRAISRVVGTRIFIAASLTDYLDGYLARIWEQTPTSAGCWIRSPTSLLVATCLLLLAANGTIAGWSLWAGIIILCREILVSGLREYLAALKVSVPVTQLAKWKTTIQMIAIGFLLSARPATSSCRA
jgi:cardiolipin synthase (CMP-forming)